MSLWINTIAVVIVCGSVAIVFIPLSILNDFPKIFSINFHTYVAPLTKNRLQYYIEDQYFASSVWCLQRSDGSKRCNFKNIFYMPQFREHLVFLLNEHSVLSGVDSVASLRDINLSTIQNHTNCFLKLIILRSKEYILNQDFQVVDDNTLIMKRFKPDNIMHVIHDDLLPLYITYQELCQGNIEHCLSTYHLIFLDDDEEGPFFEWYTIFSNHRAKTLKYQNIGILLKNSLIGLSQESIWFDYGFKNFQGPLFNSHFNTVSLNKFSIFIKQKLGINENNYISNLHEPIIAVLLNRMLNRKILNDNNIEKYILNAYANVNRNNVYIMKMDLLVNGSKSLISVLQYTNLLVGMHGSAMMFSIFMPKGSKIIELFPYGIQPKVVSPIKALCSFLNTYYMYWVNKNESNSITHPEYPPLHGGITHLSSLEQENIIRTKIVPPVRCCHNPLYLFRMFQDTIVDESFYFLLNEVLNHSTVRLNNEEYDKRLYTNMMNKWYFPPPVFNLTCECVNNQLQVLWSFPFNSLYDVKFSVYVSNGFSITVYVTHLNISMLECEIEQLSTFEHMQQAPLSVWVKTLEDSKESIDSYKLCSYLK